MNLRSSLACTSSDIARWGLRSVLKRQGGVLPGRIAMKIDPELLSDLAGLVDRSVVITGTNGKTTTSNLIADAVAASGAAVVCNRAGNNMEPGVVGALLEARGGLKHTSSGKRVGVFECDELYTVRVLPKLKPTYFVLLNLFRDQLDRYGEIDHTRRSSPTRWSFRRQRRSSTTPTTRCAPRLPRAFPMRVLPLASTAPPTPSPTALATRAFARSATPRWSTTTCNTASLAHTIAPRAVGHAPHWSAV
ncbi:MAG: Mur ligase family protein [Collinsella sp.]